MTYVLPASQMTAYVARVGDTYEVLIDLDVTDMSSRQHDTLLLHWVRGITESGAVQLARTTAFQQPGMNQQSILPSVNTVIDSLALSSHHVMSCHIMPCRAGYIPIGQVDLVPTGARAHTSQHDNRHRHVSQLTVDMHCLDSFVRLPFFL